MEKAADQRRRRSRGATRTTLPKPEVKEEPEDDTKVKEGPDDDAVPPQRVMVELKGEVKEEPEDDADLEQLEQQALESMLDML